MERRKYSPMRLAMLLLLASLVLGIGLSLAQTPAVHAPADTPKVAQAAEPSGAPAQPVAAAAKAAPAADSETDAAETTESEAASAANEAEADAMATQGRTVSRMRTTTQAQREAAAKRVAQRLVAARRSMGGVAPRVGTYGCTAPLGTPCGNADYFGTVPNYALTKLPILTEVSPGSMPRRYTVLAGTGIRKFVDGLPGLGPANKNGLANYIPIATPMANPWGLAGQYYEIGLKDDVHQFSTDLPATTQIRGYVDLNPTPLSAFRAPGDTKVGYLGPIIVAATNVPVRVKFTNNLAAGSKLFIPADASYMGMTHKSLSGTITDYSINRATLHLHGGATPWISDGTPHQWTVPVGEFAGAIYKRGPSASDVPDMWFDPTTHLPVAKTATGAVNDPGPGSLSFFWSNQQSSRLMFYHDHAWGTTRLNVYGGEAAGYLVHDATLDALIDTGDIPNNSGVDKTLVGNLTAAGLNIPGGLYHFGIPLVIQDKTFVPSSTGTGAVNLSLGIFPVNGGQIQAQDPTWNWGPEGNLWFPHVYMPNQNPNDDSGASAMGRWDYGPWFWPPMTSSSLEHNPSPGNCAGAMDLLLYPGGTCPATLNPSGAPESFMDTPVINGQAYPTVTLPKGAYRFQILNAANDRMFNMSLFYAADKDGNVCNPSYSGTFNNASPATANVNPSDWHACTEVKMVPAVQHPQSWSTPTVGGLPAPEPTPDSDDTLPACVSITGNTDVLRGSGFLVMANPSAVDYNPTTGLPGLTRACWPSSWPTDGRDGGVPDPASAGPAWIQIGTEGGVLPAPVIIPPTPVGYNYNRRDIVVTNVQEHALFLGPAERADVIVDLTNVPDGATLMLYNDSPAPVPGYDVRLDYYTGDPDLTSTGGAPTTQPGYGPNIRTMMQIHVAGTGTSTYTPANLSGLQADLPGVFKATQPEIIIPQTTYPAGAINGPLPAKDTYARIQNMDLTYTPTNASTPVTLALLPKAIHELFESDYGKMNSVLAEEIPLTNFNNQTTLPLAYIDPPTDIVRDGETQLWKVTHNGVDSHAIHFHLFNVQLINRVGWDGAIRPPDPNEMGWKETVRMNPLEDAFVALRPVKMTLPFAIGGSNRLLDPSRDEGATNVTGLPGFSNIDPNGNPLTISNAYTDFGWEYVWHCHLLGHEESDMMRPIVFQVASPIGPFNLTGHITGIGAAQQDVLSWHYTQGAAPATQFVIRRSIGGPGAYTTIGSPVAVTGLPAPGTNSTYTDAFVDPNVTLGTTYFYQVLAEDATSLSTPSNAVSLTPLVTLNPPRNVAVASKTTSQVVLSWSAPLPITGGTVTGYTIQRSTNGTTWTTVGTSTSTTFRNTGLTTRTTYYYQVRATGTGAAPSAYTALTGTTVTTN